MAKAARAKNATSKKAPSKETSAKKTSAKKTSAKKAAPAQSAPKKASAKKAAAKRAKAATGTIGADDAGATVYKLGVGDPAPAFSAAATSGGTVTLAGLKGKKAVLYFYPKDNTPGCTLEGYDFKKLHAAFRKAGAEIYGVSKDGVRSHEGFKAKCGFPFELLSDESGSLCQGFDVIQMKSLYGRKYEGIERSTFVIDESGIVRAAWRKVKVAGHADEVLQFVKGL